MLHDTETGAQRVLWEHWQDKPELLPFDGICGGSVRRVCVTYVAVPWHVYTCPLDRYPAFARRIFHGFSYRKWLEFRLNEESGELVDSAVMDGPAETSFSSGREKFCARKSPFLPIPTTQRLVLDTRTPIFYGFPRFRVALVRGGSYE